MMQPNQPMISKQKVLALCPDMETTYKQMKRNKFYCPKLKCNLITMKFMRGVIFKTHYWLPKLTDMTFHSCADEPSGKEIALELSKILIKACNIGNWSDQAEKERCKNTALLIADFPPDKEWALNVMGTFLERLKESHRYFQKDFVKPKRVDLQPELDDGLVPHQDDFFAGLPEPEKKVKQKRSTLVGLTKRERMQRGLHKLQLRRQQQDARIAKLQAAIDNDVVEEAKAGQHVGRKRRRRDVEEPEPANQNVNIIRNLQDVEESKDDVSDAQSEVPQRRSTRQKSKSPTQNKKGGKGSQSKILKTPRSKSPGGVQTRQRINAGEMTGSAEITNIAAKLSLKESKTVRIGQFKTAPEEQSDEMDIDTVSRKV